MARTPQQGQLGGIALIAAGFGLVFYTIGGYALGYVIDRKIGTAPWGAVIGLFLGFVVGVWDIFRIARRVVLSQPLPPSKPEENIPGRQAIVRKITKFMKMMMSK